MKNKKNSNNLKSLYIVLNKLNDPSLDCIDLLGIICFIIYSKDIFPKNKDIIPFLDEVFNIKFLKYVISSRTLIVARVSKHVNVMNINEKKSIPNKIIKYFKIQNLTISKSNRKKNANEKLETWLKGL